MKVAGAIDTTTIFQLDGNTAVTAGSPDDWDRLAGGGGSAKSFSGIVADPTDSSDTGFGSGLTKDTYDVPNWSWEKGGRHAEQVGHRPRLRRLVHGRLRQPAPLLRAGQARVVGRERRRVLVLPEQGGSRRRDERAGTSSGITRTATCSSRATSRTAARRRSSTSSSGIGLARARTDEQRGRRRVRCGIERADRVHDLEQEHHVHGAGPPNPPGSSSTSSPSSRVASTSPSSTAARTRSPASRTSSRTRAPRPPPAPTSRTSRLATSTPAARSSSRRPGQAPPATSTSKIGTSSGDSDVATGTANGANGTTGESGQPGHVLVHRDGRRVDRPQHVRVDVHVRQTARRKA